LKLMYFDANNAPLDTIVYKIINDNIFQPRKNYMCKYQLTNLKTGKTSSIGDFQGTGYSDYYLIQQDENGIPNLKYTQYNILGGRIMLDLKNCRL